MKISGISRGRMSAELDRMYKERLESINNSQCINIPYERNIDGLVPTDEEAIRKQKEEFSKLEGYTDDIYSYLSAIEASAHMHSIMNVFLDPTFLLSPVLAEDALKRTNTAVMHYIDKLIPFGQDTIDNDPFISLLKGIDGIYGKMHITTKKYGKCNLFLGSDAVQEGYGYSHKIACSSEEVEIPVAMIGKNVVERVGITEILLNKPIIEQLEGVVFVTDFSIFKYAAYMAHLNPKVSKVYVIIDDDDIGGIFMKEILPRAKYPEKIVPTTLNELRKISFNCCYYRMWNEIAIYADLYMESLSALKETGCPSYFYMGELMMEHIKNVVFAEIIKQTDIETVFALQVNKEGFEEILKRIKDISILTPDKLQEIFQTDKLRDIITSAE